MKTSRRAFMKVTGTGVAAMAVGGTALAKDDVPSYLEGYEKEYAADPIKAAVKWFREAKFGLFLHYGLYSNPAGVWKGKTVPGISEWLQYRAAIHIAEYAKLKDQFTAEKFDADAIAELAVAAGMKYINITTRHHDSFSLWDTKQNDFNSMKSPARRDLVGELAAACRKKKLGFCLYYSHGRDWRHPHAPNNDGWGGAARPKFKKPDPYYKYGAEHDLGKYVAFMEAQVTELLTNYGPIANIWLDGIGVPFKPKKGNTKAMFRCQELYDHVHKLQPQCLVSYKQGLLGTEDFFAPEHKAVKTDRDAPMEICTTLQKGSWGHKKGAPWAGADQAWEKLTAARKIPANLLLNVGPMGDGSIPPKAAAVLREVGQRIRKDGWPG